MSLQQQIITNKKFIVLKILLIAGFLFEKSNK